VKLALVGELTESRLIRKFDQLDSYSFDKLVELMFAHLLALGLLTRIDMPKASKYAGKVMLYPEFIGFRMSQPDLYNLIAFVMNADRFPLRGKYPITLPYLRMRRVLSNIERGKPIDNDYHEMMLMIQRECKNLPARWMMYRRRLSEYDSLDRLQQQELTKLIRTHLRDAGRMQSDLHQILLK